jgi:heat-inducible transcriptional repressor
MEESNKLDQRQKAILYFIIQSYCRDGSPVGSRLISKQYGEEQLSPASIRNVMADLEDMGLLSQPHVSAGRVPTDSALRLMVEDIIRERSFIFADIETLGTDLEKKSEDMNSFFSLLSKELSERTGYIGIVLTPAIADLKCRNIHFIKIEDKKVLAIFVSSYGIVHNRLIHVEENYTQDQLERISNLVNERLQGITITEMLTKIGDMLKEEKVQYDTLLKQALDLSGKSASHIFSEQNQIYYSGTENFLGSMTHEEFDRMINLYKAFEDKAKLFTLLRQCLKEGEINVIIGSENLYRDFRDFSLVSATYSTEGNVLGTLAVLGPKRMNYDSIMGLVYYSTKIVNRLLIEGGL